MFILCYFDYGYNIFCSIKVESKIGIVLSFLKLPFKQQTIFHNGKCLSFSILKKVMFFCQTNSSPQFLNYNLFLKQTFHHLNMNTLLPHPRKYKDLNRSAFLSHQKFQKFEVIPKIQSVVDPKRNTYVQTIQTVILPSNMGVGPSQSIFPNSQEIYCIIQSIGGFENGENGFHEKQNEIEHQNTTR